MKNLNDFINEATLDYVAQDYHKFSKDYKKFREYFEKEPNETLKDALENIANWIKDIDKHKGIPASYPRYEQFTYAIVTYDPTARKGFGDLYDEKITKSLIDAWEKSTGYKIRNIYQ